MHPHARAQKKTRSQLIRLVNRWHRRIGITAALFVVWIVMSGWLLNHSDSLGMGRIELRNTALATWYGLKVDIPKQMFATENHIIISNQDNFLFDMHPLGIQQMAVIGAAQSTGLVAVGTENFLVLFDHSGHMVDTLNSGDLPFPSIKKIGSGCNSIVIAGETKTLASSDGLDWKPCGEKVVWSTPSPISTEQLAQAKNLLAPNISLEKLVIDLHTGRFFGRFGPYVVDFIGACLMLLALSGLWMFFKTTPKSKH